ncbi:MAG: metal ABC transporter substrate-binding protein [Marmoricola sp.]
MWSRLVPVVVLVGVSAFAGCGVSNPPGTQVVAAFYPLAWAAQQVAGDDATITDLTTPGVEPHDVEPTVRQTARLSQADLVVYEKSFQPSVDASVKQNARASLDVSEVVRLHQTDRGTDPHFWQDPLRMAAYVDALGSRLAAIDPAHAKDFRARAAALHARLARLDADYRAGLSDCRLHTIVVSHDAFGYLAKYDITVQGVAGLTPDAEPSAKHLHQLQQLIAADQVTTVFSEKFGSSTMSNALATDLGIESRILDPIEGVGKSAPAGTSYLTIMRANLQVLRKANRC